MSAISLSQNPMTSNFLKTQKAITYNFKAFVTQNQLVTDKKTKKIIGYSFFAFLKSCM